ncbi:MAG: aspartate aminotransferase family protein [Cytophagales bacterium]|nr:aspartate aminotransferase family protein [Cytophagales bacterium]
MENNYLAAEGDINQSRKRKQWNEQLPAHTLEWLRKDAKYFLRQNLSTPLDVIREAEGTKLINLKGGKYLDFHGSSVHQIGFQNEQVIEKVREQLNKLSFCTGRYTNIPAIQLAEKLIESTGHKFSKALFAPEGSLAIGMALKLARAITGKHKVISFWDSLYGTSTEAIFVDGEVVSGKNTGTAMPGIERIPPPNLYRGILGRYESKYIEYFEYIVQKEGDIAAFIAEPIRNTDVTIPTKNFWRQMRKICDKYGIFLIFDETVAGLGRIGNLFVWQYYDVIPDVVCLGKGLGGGVLPLAGILTHEKYDKVKNISIGHYTHEKNPLCAAAGLTTLEFIEREELLAKVQSDEVFIREKVSGMMERFKLIGEVRGKGLLWAIELVKDRRTKEKALFETETIMYNCLKDGLNFKIAQGNIIMLVPPLTVSRQELDKALYIIDRNICKMSKFIN